MNALDRIEALANTPQTIRYESSWGPMLMAHPDAVFAVLALPAVVPLLVAVARAAQRRIERWEECALCGRRILYSDGWWVHADFGKTDGVNGLYCTPEMWNEDKRRNAFPKGPTFEAALAAVDRYAQEHLPA